MVIFLAIMVRATGIVVAVVRIRDRANIVVVIADRGEDSLGAGLSWLKCDVVGTGCYDAREDLMLCYCSDDLQYLEEAYLIYPRGLLIFGIRSPRSELIVIDNPFYSMHLIR